MEKLSKVWPLLIVFFINSCSPVSNNEIVRVSSSGRVPASSSSCIKLFQKIGSKRFDLKDLDLDNNLYAFHLTDFLPQKGMISSDNAGRSRFPSTLHFSLGEPVISHDLGNWHNKKFAVLVPMKDLKDQMLNLMAQDTFILGDLKLGKEAILVLPKGASVPTGYLGRIFNYEKDESIYEAAKAANKKFSGIELKAENAQANGKLFLNNQEVDPTKFFGKYFSDNKNLTQKLHAQTFAGKIDMNSVNLLSRWLKEGRDYPMSLKNMKFDLMMLKLNIERLDQDFKMLQLPKVSMDSYARNKKEINSMLNILSADIELRQKYRRSFIASSGDLQDEILSRRFNLKDLSQFVEKKKKSFPVVKDDGSGVSLDYILSDLDWIPLSRFEKIVKTNKDFLGHDDFSRSVLILKKSGLELDKGLVPVEEVISKCHLSLKYVSKNEYEALSQLNEIFAFYSRLKNESGRKAFISDPQIREAFRSRISAKDFSKNF
jgi:hypothetical protein